MSETEQRLALLWFEWVTRDKRCAVCGAREGERIRGDYHGLRVHIQAHHLIQQQTLRRRARDLGVLPQILLWDARIGLPVCSYPCHSRHTSRQEPIPRRKVPSVAWDFADEWGLTHVLDRVYPEAPA